MSSADESKKPDNVPDMSLPERSANPPSERIEPAATPGYTLVPTPTPSWRVGDRVLAPWEPNFLYVGTIREIAGNDARIEFADGDAGWVLVKQIQQLAVRVGQQVLSRRNMGPHFFPAEIEEVTGEEVLVAFTDGGPEEWTTIAALRIPCAATGPMAEPTQVASHLAFHKNLRAGQRVWAPWSSSALFVGTVDEIKEGEVHVHFDDGDRGWVQLTQLLPLELPIGLRVLGRWKMGNDFFAGAITQVRGRQVHIHYDDGDKEWTTTAALALPCQPFGPDARPTNFTGRWNPVLNWLIPIGIGLLICMLRVGCRSMN